MTAAMTACSGAPEPVTPLTSAARPVGVPTSPAPAIHGAVARLLPYSLDGRSLEAIRTLYAIGHLPGDEASREAQYLAAAASADLAAFSEFRGDTETLRALAQIRGLPQAGAALYTALDGELRAIRNGVYAPAAAGLLEGVGLLRAGARTARGAREAQRLIDRGSPAAYLAMLFYIDAVRQAVGSMHEHHEALETLASLGHDPCAAGCPQSSLSHAPEEARRAAAAIRQAFRLTAQALTVTEDDPFAGLVRPYYEESRTALARVALPDRGGARGAPAARILVDLTPDEARMVLLPVVAVVDGEIDRQTSDPNAFLPQKVPYLRRWSAKVAAYEPFTRAATEIRARAIEYLNSPGSAATDEPARDSPPVAIVVNDEVPAHVLARVILSLRVAGLEDLRLRRQDQAGSYEVRLSSISSQGAEERERERARVEIFGPFDYDGATRTLQRHALAGRRASAQLVLFALIASRALYRAIDAVRATWPDAEPDIMLVLPQQVP